MSILDVLGTLDALGRSGHSRALLERPRTSVLDVLGALDALGRYWSILDALERSGRSKALWTL